MKVMSEQHIGEKFTPVKPGDAVADGPENAVDNGVEDRRGAVRPPTARFSLCCCLFVALLVFWVCLPCFPLWCLCFSLLRSRSCCSRAMVTYVNVAASGDRGVSFPGAEAETLGPLCRTFRRGCTASSR